MALGTWLSAFFILVANSWMQRPVGYKIVDGKAELTSVGELLSNPFALTAWLHTILAGLIFGSMVMLGVSCWHFLRGRNVDLFRRAAKLALIVAVPATLIQLSVGNRFGEAVTSAQGMKIAASEAQWNTCQPCGFSVFQIGGFSAEDPDPSFAITIPRLLSWMATGSFDGKVQGLNQLQAAEEQQYGPGNYMPRVRLMYWSMRVMAMLGVAMFLIAAVGAWLYRKRKLHEARWFQRTAIVAIAFPYLAATAGWILTEMGRQPWIVQDLLKTSDAVSPNISTATVATSLSVFVLLYLTLGIVDFVLMRRYARVDPPQSGDGDGLGGLARTRNRRRQAERAEMGLEEFWFVLIAVLWGGYFLLEGFDFGVGMLLPFLPRDERERGLMFESIGPVWDGNEVWLVVAGGATFAAFPAWYATMFSGFYLALLLHPRPADRSRRLVRVAREARQPALAGHLAVGEHDRKRRRRVHLGRGAGEPRPRGAAELLARLHAATSSTCSARTPCSLDSRWWPSSRLTARPT